MAATFVLAVAGYALGSGVFGGDDDAGWRSALFFGSVMVGAMVVSALWQRRARKAT